MRQKIPNIYNNSLNKTFAPWNVHSLELFALGSESEFNKAIIAVSLE